MKKYFILCAVFIIAALLLSTAGASSQLTRDEVVNEWKDILESLPDEKIVSDLSLGAGFTVDGRTIRGGTVEASLSKPDGSSQKTVPFSAGGSWCEIVDDVVLIQETDDSWFTGSANTGLPIGGSGSRIVGGGSTALEPGARVLILETNGDMRSFYAAEGTTGRELFIGDRLNMSRCFNKGHIGGAGNGSFPIPILPVFIPFGGGEFYGGDGDLIVHFDIDFEYGGLYIDVNEFALEIQYNDCKLILNDIGITVEGVYPIIDVSVKLPYGFVLDMSPAFGVEGQGKGSSQFKMSVKEGIHAEIYGGVVVDDAGWDHTDPKVELLDTDMEGETYAGLEWGGALTYMKLIGAGPFYKAGFVLEAAASTSQFDPDDKNRKVMHACDIGGCIEGSSFVRNGPLSVSIVGLDGHISVPVWSPTDPHDYPPFMEFYVSKTFNDRSMSSRCPHKAYRLDVFVINESRTDLPDAVVSANVSAPYKKLATGVTDKKGETIIYVPEGTFDLTAELTSPLDPSWIISKKVSFTQDTGWHGKTFTLDVPQNNVYFKNPASGKAADWPEDLVFMPFYSRDVTLPGQIPSLSGRQFTGWNTAADGSGTTYAPGAALTLSEDLTLWAQWQTAGSSWYVIYNANGGTWAPPPEIVPQGQAATLTGKPPESKSMFFRGWTADPDAAAVEYMPGDTLPYDSGKNVVVLYALWSLSPAPRPVRVSFDANGVPDADLPADVWIERDSRLKLQPAAAPLGSSWSFRGWSKKPDAKEPEYPAGASYRFDQDTRLYAIWNNLDSITLTFRDSLPDAATGIPAPISILPSMSRDVRIPDAIPEKSGRIFTEWNTAADGSGTAYAPGTKLTLPEDLTLWAQWQTAGSSWYVIYNANGGTWAPPPEIVPRGRAAVLTGRSPESESMFFRGWATDPGTAAVEYMPGDTLPYDSGKNVVILYALWSLSPGPRQVSISFDANGVPDADLPADILIGWGSMLQLPPAVAPLGSFHSFRGWSENPGAEEPEYPAGVSYRFDRNTRLYAIWNILSSITLTFRDPLPDAVSGIPAPISILPSMSRDVRISDAIPEKADRVFTEWNTVPDGSGIRYDPGSVFTLLENTTLWAQWKLADWYVIYDANGGTWAPPPEIVPCGQAAVLTGTPPENKNKVFKGWALNPDAAAAEYMPGDTLPYDSGKKEVILYALWSLSPAERPVIISFNANGGRPDTVPQNCSVPKSEWFRLPEETPSWDAQHDFLGWAANPQAADPEWQAGSTVRFEQDTVLCAIWDPHYKVIEGAGSVWIKGSGKTQRFVADGDLQYFIELRVDNLPFIEGVQISSGSTIADISASAMEKLSVGEHTVTFVYMDGQASATFSVRPKIPPTGDAGRPALWTLLVLFGITGLALLSTLTMTAKRKK